MKIAYFGLPLGALLLAGAGYPPNLVVLSPVSAPGRRRVLHRLQKSVVVDFLAGAVEQRVGLELARLAPDLLLSWFWTRRLPAVWLRAPRLGAYGVHPSLLPRHRGPNPYFAAIDAGDVVTGATLHRLEDEYDTGDIVASETLEVGEKNGWQLARALDRPSLRLLLAAARSASRGQPLAAQPQSSRAATWAGEPEESQRRVDWSWSTERVLRRIRALSPVPGLALEVDRVKFFVTHALAIDPPTLALAPGEAALSAGQLLIRTGDGAVSVQRAVLADTEAELDGRAMANLLAERTGAAR